MLNVAIGGTVLSDFKTYSSATEGIIYFLLCNTTMGDQPYRAYYYSSTSTATPDDDSVIENTAIGGRFIKIPTDASSVSPLVSVPNFAGVTTATRLSTSRFGLVQYAFDATVTISLLAGQSITAILEYADNSGMSTNVVTLDSCKTSNSGVLGLTQINTLKVGGGVPAGKYRRVRFTTTGSATTPSSVVAAQEILL